MKIISSFFVLLTSFQLSFSQNTGIGTQTPSEKLDVIGKVKMDGLIIALGGISSDFLIKSNATGEVAFRKGHGGLGLNYIICLEGAFIDPDFYAESPFVGEIKIIAGEKVPKGWAFCHGQLLSINQNIPLFSILGNRYGGNGTTTFALPNLRNAAAIGAGDLWQTGTRSN